MTGDDLLLVNCAQCGLEMLGETHRYLAKKRSLPAIAGRLNGRPFCCKCIAVRKPPNKAATRDDGPSPWQENAIRDMEGE